MAGMMAAFADTLNLVAHREQDEMSSRLALGSGIDPEAALRRDELEARAMLIREIAPTKAVMLAVQEVLADYSTWRLPEFQVETAARSETLPALAHVLTDLTMRYDAEVTHQPLETILRWALAHASDAPYASYRADEIEGFADEHQAASGQIPGRYMVMTREEEFVFGDLKSWRDKMAELDRPQDAAPAPGNAGRDEDASPSPASYGGL